MAPRPRAELRVDYIALLLYITARDLAGVPPGGAATVRRRRTAERARERPIWRTGSPWGRCALRCSGVDNTHGARFASADFNWQFRRRVRLHAPDAPVIIVYYYTI